MNNRQGPGPSSPTGKNVQELSSLPPTSNLNDSDIDPADIVNENDIEANAAENNSAAPIIPSSLSTYTKVKYASNTLSMIFGYVTAHYGYATGVVTQLPFTISVGGFDGGISCAAKYTSDDQNLTWREGLILTGSNIASSVTTDLLVNAMMTAGGGLCWWMPPLLVGGLVVAPEVLPAAWQKFTMWQQARKAPLTANNEDQNVSNSSPSMNNSGYSQIY